MSLEETLKRISELAPELVKTHCPYAATAVPVWMFGEKYVDSPAGREAIIDWLVGKGFTIEAHYGQGCGLRLYPNQFCHEDEAVSIACWKSSVASRINAESEIHALLLCVLAVFQSEATKGDETE